jgi:RimJ/RimL family protein N-acetyltransferase
MSAPFALEGTHVRLEPLSISHVDGLVAAATGDRSTFGYTTVPVDQVSFTRYIERALEHAGAGDQVPFATISLALGRVVGSTRFYDIEAWDWPLAAPGVDPAPFDKGVDRTFDRVGIGHTWLDPAVQRSAVNTEAKFLMLDHAFSTWGVRAVRFQTDARNARSRAAIARLGCTLDGVLRADRAGTDGTVRDSAVFSMVAEEWPAARLRLIDRLAH